MTIQRAQFRSEEVFVLAQEVSNSLLKLSTGDLNVADSIQALEAISRDAVKLAQSVRSKAKADHAEELFASLNEVMSWYRNRTKPEMPHDVQERAINALWLAKGAPSSDEDVLSSPSR